MADDRRLPVPRVAVQRRAVTRSRSANLVGDHEPLERAMNLGVERADRPEPMRMTQPLQVVGRAGRLVQPPVVAEPQAFGPPSGLIVDEPSPVFLDRQSPPPLSVRIDHRSSSRVGISIPAQASGGFTLAGRRFLRLARLCAALLGNDRLADSLAAGAPVTKQILVSELVQQPRRPVAISSSLGRCIPDSTSSRFTYPSAEAPNGRATSRRNATAAREALVPRVLEPHPAEVATVDPQRPLPVQRWHR